MASDVSCLRDLVKRFYSLQQERVETYQLFEEGFQAYLGGAPHYNFPMYRQLVHEITQTFSKISQDIISIKEGLEANQRRTIAELIDKIQNEEKTKLESTVKFQLAQQSCIDHPDVENNRSERDSLKQSLQEILIKITEYLEELKFETEDLYEEVDITPGTEAVER